MTLSLSVATQNQVGFNAGDGSKSMSHQYSRDGTFLAGLVTESNIEIAGLWAYYISSVSVDIGGCTTAGEYGYQSLTNMLYVLYWDNIFHNAVLKKINMFDHSNSNSKFKFHFKFNSKLIFNSNSNFKLNFNFNSKFHLIDEKTYLATTPCLAISPMLLIESRFQLQFLF